MSSAIIYRELLSVQLLHSYYLNGTSAVEFVDNANPALHDSLSDWVDIPFEKLQQIPKEQLQRAYNIHQDIEIQPTPATSELLNRQKLRFQPTNNGFFIGCRVESIESDPSVFTPYVPFENPFTLRFALILKNPLFLNFSNLRSSNGHAKIYHFSNNLISLPGGDTTTPLFLNRPIPTHNLTDHYFSGDLVQNAAQDTLYEALQDNIGTTLPTVSDAFWRQIPLKSYINHTDEVSSFPRVFSINIEDLALNRLDEVFSVQVSIPNTSFSMSFSTTDPNVDPIESVKVVIPAEILPSGLYTLQIELNDSNAQPIQELSASTTFYLNGLGMAKKIFAIIELHHSPNASLGLYGFLDYSTHTEGVLHSPEYVLWWKNRSTKWYFKEMQGISSANNNGALLEIETDEPVPLTKINRSLGLQADNNNPPNYSITPDPDLGTQGDLQLLPNASTDRIRKEGANWYSDVFFHLKP